MGLQDPTLKPLPNFCVVDLSLKVGLRWMLGLRLSIMSRSLPSLQIVLRNQRPVLTPWNQLLQVLFCLGKRFYTEDDVENDSSLITLSNEDLSGMAQTETTKASSETVDRGNP